MNHADFFRSLPQDNSGAILIHSRQENVLMDPLETIDLNARGGIRDYFQRFGQMH
jgi:hypothetical protein